MRTTQTCRAVILGAVGASIAAAELHHPESPASDAPTAAPMRTPADEQHHTPNDREPSGAVTSRETVVTSSATVGISGRAVRFYFGP